MLKVTVEVHNAMDDASKRPIFKQAYKHTQRQVYKIHIQ